MSTAITMIIFMIVLLMILPSKKKAPVKKFDDKVIDFVAGRACLRDAR